MKKILIVFCLTATIQGYAQQPAIKVVSKTEFSAKAGELNTLLKQNNKVLFNVKWDEIHELMRLEFDLVKDRIYVATVNNNESDRIHYNDILDKQVEIYNAIIGIRNSSFKDADMLHNKLDNYSATLIN